MEDLEDNALRNQRSYFVEKYLQEVIKPFLPKAYVGKVYSFGPPKGLYKSAEIGIGYSSKSFIGSKYYYKGKNEFIHYTSFPNLINILNDKAIRMYDFNYLNDPKEFVFASQYLGDLQFNYNDIKSQLFSLSMCEYDEVIKPDSFDMWRLYGQFGKGVGIVLEFEKQNRKHWFNSYLSKIFYGEKYLKSFEGLKQRHDDFHRNNDFSIRNFQEIFLQLHAFHKHSIYASENEVRLLKFIEKTPIYEDHNASDVFLCSNSRFELSYYTHLELDSPEWRKSFERFDDMELRDHAFRLYPTVKIKKVVLGYEFSRSSLYDIGEIVNKISIRNLGYNIPISISPLAEVLR